MEKLILPLWFIVLTVSLVSGCGNRQWNSPYAPEDASKNILYTVFSERPKHLDPVQSYSSNEIQFTAQIYESPLQYHYLKRPFMLMPATAVEIPVVKYFDRQDRLLPDDARATDIAFSVYEITIKPGIFYQPHPALAVTDNGDWLYHHLNSDDLKSIFTLSDFSHTGTRELVADDYVYQIKRLAHPRLHSPIYGLMADYIVGLAPYAETLKQVNRNLREGEVFLNLSEYALDGVQAIDRYTYRIKLHGKYPQFLYWLAMPFFAPIPWEADRFYSQPGLVTKNITLDWYPIGTGPYMLTENNPNLRMILDRNPNFRDELYPADGMPGDAEKGLLEDAGKQIPFVEKIVFIREKESIPRWNKFLQGYYDASGIGSDSFDQAVQFAGQGEAVVTDEMAAQGIRLETTVAVSTYYMGFNMLDPVVGGGIDPRAQESARKLRQAISIAVDFEEFISIFANGRGIPAHSPIPPGIAGYRDGKEGINSVVYHWVNGQPLRRSIKEAKELLRDAGYPDGIDQRTGAPLILYFDVTSRSADDRSKLDWMRKQFQKLNLQLVVRSTDYNRFQDKIRKGNAQIFEWGWNADYPDPENFLFLLYGPQRKVGNSGENAVNYNNEEYNQLFDRMKNLEDGDERLLIIERMVEILRYDAPWLWGYHPKDYALYHAWYQNIKPNRISNNSLKYFKINAEMRVQKQKEWNAPVLWPVVLVFFVLILGLVPAVMAYLRFEGRTALKDILQ